MSVFLRPKWIIFLGFVALGLVSGFFLYGKLYEKKVEKATVQDIQTLVKQAENVNFQPPFDIPNIGPLSFPAKICNIKNYGAQEGRKNINTEAINDAVADCAGNGGGQVLVPKGKWLTGTIHLKSNIDLHLEKGAELVFSTNPDDYLPVVLTRFEGMELMNYSPFIYTKDAQNVAISGEGKLNGQGMAWDEWTDRQDKAVDKLYHMSFRNEPVESRVFGTKDDALRPSFIQFFNCKDISVSGVTITDGPMWTMHFVYSENVRVDKTDIQTKGRNTDGIVIDSSRNIIIEDSIMDTGDDAISIKSGLDAEGQRIARPSENVVIRNSIMENSHSGVGIGSEMSGGVRNIFVYNCRFNSSSRGVYIKSLKGRGGFVDGVRFQNITMKKIEGEAVGIDMNYSAYTIAPHTRELPVFRNISFDGITCDGAEEGILVTGLSKQAVENISFNNINISSKEGASVSNGSGISFQNVGIKTDKSKLTLENCRNVSIENLSCDKDDGKCIQIKGKQTLNVQIKNTPLISSGMIKIEDGLDPGVLSVSQ